MTTINMQTMRYINLLDRQTRVKTSNCFVYNNIIFFAVPRAMMSKAIGPGATNIKSLQNQLGKRVKIISQPNNPEDYNSFIKSIIEPVGFKSLEVKDGSIILTAGGKQNKAGLIGRNKQRLLELKKVTISVFKKDVKVI